MKEESWRQEIEDFRETFHNREMKVPYSKGNKKSSFQDPLAKELKQKKKTKAEKSKKKQAKKSRKKNRKK